MDLATLGLYSVALLVYPGALSLLVLGLLVEAGASWALVSGTPLGGLVRNMRRMASSRALPPTASGTVLLTMLAASQLAAPFNPVPPGERNLLVAGVALACAVWLVWPGSLAGSRSDARYLLLVQAGWLAALLALAVGTDTLFPQFVGAAIVASLIPLKLAAGLLYVLCLPGLLGLAGPLEGRKTVARTARMLLWLPFCGLFASLLFPPAPDDVLGLARFLGASLLAAALALGVAVVLVRGRERIRLGYLVTVAVCTVLTLVAAAITVFAA